MNQWHQKYREFVKALNPSEKEINEFIRTSNKNNCSFNRNLSEIQKIALLCH